MAYKKKELEKLALDALDFDDNIVFIEDLISVLPCTKTTFYNHKLHELDSIKDVIQANRINLKKELRTSWRKSDNATLQIGLYKLIADEDEAHRLNGSKQEIKSEIKHSISEETIKKVNESYERFANNSDFV